MKANFIAMTVGLLTSLAGWGLIWAFNDYGLTLFLGTPFVMGCTMGIVADSLEPDKPAKRLGLILKAVIASLWWMFLFGIDGLICLAMALPVYLLLALIGGGTGLAVAHLVRNGRQRLFSVLVLLALIPLMGGFEDRLPKRPTVYQVTTRIRIDASPEQVWKNVINFTPISEPTDWLFRLGVAYPTHAVLKYDGERWVRECHFSTGAFIEPITHWEEPYRLAFDVESQPDPMKELSPYDIHPPHLDGFFQTTHGEFRLTALSDGGTELQGTTWYCIHILPEWYWKYWCDFLIHKIHLRVLRHIEANCENDC